MITKPFSLKEKSCVKQSIFLLFDIAESCMKAGIKTIVFVHGRPNLCELAAFSYHSYAPIS